MATMRDVAKRANVTTMTVSRVLNNSGYVKDSTRTRVERAIQELNYVPNLLGQSLRFNRTHTIGLIISDISNPYWTQIIKGVEHIISETPYNIFLCDSQSSESREMDHIENLIKKQVDGILIAPVVNMSEPISFVQKQRVPIVVIGYPMPYVDVDVVRCDTKIAAHDLVKLLIGLGHQRIAMLSGPKNIVTAVERVTGYKQALKDAGIPVDNELIQFGHFTLESGYEMAEEMLNLSPLPTAVVTGNNFIAIGATKALRNAGIRIPADISIVTFDGPPPELVIDPFFTMVSQPGFDIGKHAANILLERLTGDDEFPFKEIILPTEITINSSTAPI